LSNAWAKGCLVLICTVLLAAVCSAAQSTGSSASTSQRFSSSAKHKQSAKSGKSKKSAGKHGQQKIDSQRAREIQEALIREHYLSGQPSGNWDDATQKAMQKFQADNGWQDKTTPDARALIKLGLGPDHEHLLNPETAMTAPHVQAITSPSSGSEDPSSKSPR
jgi:hypothetical protein